MRRSDLPGEIDLIRTVSGLAFAAAVFAVSMLVADIAVTSGQGSSWPADSGLQLGARVMGLGGIAQSLGMLGVMACLPVLIAHLWLRRRPRKTLWRYVRLTALMCFAYIASGFLIEVADPLLPIDLHYVLETGRDAAIAILIGGVLGASFWIVARPDRAT